MTFDAGMKALDQILEGMDDFDIFVIFLSDTALNSRWVKRELTSAHKKSRGSESFQILPIIVDKNITHEDSRIPDWLREYNIKLVSQPSKAYRIIEQQMRQMLGMSLNIDTSNLSGRPLDDKVMLLKGMLDDIHAAKDIIVIHMDCSSGTLMYKG